MTGIEEPPSAAHAERAVLGTWMLNPDLGAELLSEVPVEFFHNTRHQRLYRWMDTRYREGRSVALMALLDALGGAPELNDGAMGSVVEIMEHAEHGLANPRLVGTVVRELREAYLRREIWYLTHDVAHRVREGASAVQLFGDITHRLEAAQALARGKSGPRSLGCVATTNMAKMERIWSGEASGAEDLFSTGIPDLDDALLGGFRRAELVVIGGRPGDGKTALAVQIADFAALEGRSALVFSTEMTAERLGDRLLAMWADVPASVVRRPELATAEHRRKLRFASESMQGGEQRFYIDDSPAPTLEGIQATAKRHKLRHGLDLVFLDYLQILGIRASRDGRRLEGLGEMSTGLMRMAKELGCCVVLLTQLNRQVTQRADKRPTMADIKECGKVEEDAHLILFPHRPAVHDDSADPTEALIIIGKQRGAPTGQVDVRWNGPRVCFQNADGEGGCPGL